MLLVLADVDEPALTAPPEAIISYRRLLLEGELESLLLEVAVEGGGKSS